jgi:hypothetical protein
MPPASIFVSHGAADNEWCRRFADALRVVGHDVWFDEVGEASLDASADLLATIQHQLQARDVVVPVLTPQGWASPWVRQEVQLALATRRRVFSVLLEPTEVEGFLVVRPWLDAFDRDPVTAAHETSQRLADLATSSAREDPLPAGNLERALAADVYLSPLLLGPRRLLRDSRMTRFVHYHARRARKWQRFVGIVVLVEVLLLALAGTSALFSRFIPAAGVLAQVASVIAAVYGGAFMYFFLVIGGGIATTWSHSILSGNPSRFLRAARRTRQRT